jgi:hypothetical protein
MLKQPAWAAAISSSGFVPGCDSKRVAKEYGVLFKTPLGEVSVPLPSFRPPLQCALALRCRSYFAPQNEIEELYMEPPIEETAPAGKKRNIHHGGTEKSG